MADTEISFDALPPEAQAAFSTPAVAPAEIEVDPVADLTPDELFELSNKKLFSPLEYAQQNPDRALAPDAVKKLSDVHAKIREQGFRLQDLPSAGEAVKGVGHMVAGLAKQGWNYASAIAAPFIDVAASLTGQGGPGFSEALAENAQRGLVENIAGTEAAATGLAQLPGRALGKLGQVTGLSKPYTMQTDEEKAKAFFSDLGTAQQAGEISQGRGAVTQFLSGEVQKELVEAGKPVRPEEVELTTAGDPLSFLAFGKLFGAAGKLLPSVSAAPLIEKAGEVAAKVGGRTIQGTGRLTEFGGKAVEAAAKTPGISSGGVTGALISGNIPAAVGAVVIPPITRAVARGVTKLGAKAADFGKQVATGLETTPYSQAARDIFQSAPILASDTLAGATFDLGLAAATSESPQETEAAAAFGTVLGSLKGAGRGVLKVAQGQIITPRAWGITKVTPPYKSFSSLDAAHSKAQATAAPGDAVRVNAIREFLKGADDNAQAYLMPDAATMEKAITDILVRQGATPESAAASARSAAQAKGMFTSELKDDTGKTRRVVLLNEASAAPHESFHALQDVLGEEANQVVDGLVFQEYAPQWETLGQQYAQRLGGTGDWREVVLDRSGWGNAAAAEKTLRDAANKFQSDTGALPSQKMLQARAEKVLTDARRSGAGWRDILTPAEATAEANRYLARELAAENFDAAFKNLGAGLTQGKTLPEKLARVIAKTAAFMGAEPLAGVRTEGLEIEPRFAVTEAVTRQGRTTKTATPAEVSKWAKLPETPAQGAVEADAVLEWLKTATIPVADRAAAAQTLAEAMKNQQGVRLTYFGAKGEPGGDPAALRPERRAQIEAQRDAANADRPLVSKDYYPYGSIITSKGPQFKGWSPSNFNANVTRFAEWIAAHPEAARNIPLAHDLSTEAGQRGLQADLQTFVQNQQAGFTGSGLELVVPAGAGATPPVRTGVQPVSLPQARADAISYLFNLKLPETTRITAGKTPLNIVGQRVSEATLPGRVSEPIRPRGEFTGPKAEALGIVGERVQEVNPFRQSVEKAAKDAGVKPPELIEAAQILALDRIADATGAPELPAFGGNVTTLTAGFLPRGEEILKMTPEEFMTASRGYVGGLTAEARKIGLGLTSPKELASLRQFATQAQEASKAAMARKDLDTAMAEVSKVQMFNEAVQSATGTGANGEALRAALGADYKPPFPEGPVTGQALPKKAKNELKFVPSGALGMSKAWVLPGGKVEQLAGSWHHEWLDQNKAVQEKYGLEVPAFEGGDAEGVREQALKKGFVRVNYTRNTGTLTVEARAKDWRKQKGAVERLIEENIDDIDNVTVHLMDESVQKVVDSASERLFNFDSDGEKLANLPFITKGEIRGQFLPSENKAFTDELETIRSGKSGGQTFNADGSVWQAPETPSDIVTLASVNVPRENLTAAEFEKATAPYQELLAQPNVVAGVFAFDQAGKAAASIDINAVVPQSLRENTLAFAKANDQVAIWDAAKNETVEAGGAGNTKITSPEQMRAAAESLAAGEPFQFLPAEQSGLPGITTGREFDRKAIEGMSQAQLKEYFPEAVVPKKNSEYIPSEIADSPLSKEAGSKEAAIQAFADKLVKFYRSREDNPALQAGAKWYSEFTPLLKKEFGKDSRIFAELLAATSPNNTPQINFAFALDALQNWKTGKYDKMISKFNEGLSKLADGGLEKIYQQDVKSGEVKNPPQKPSDATYLAHWIDKNNLIPMSSSGKRFSMHSVPVLKVLARKWMNLNTGPKTDNFIKNLVGEGDEATVDVWADRTMRRLGYEGFKDRWRIMPRNKTGVTDADFIFSQEAFRKAAEELDMKPSALQGALWFAEKQYWSEQGWGRLDLGDYKTELERMPQLKAGFKSREARAKAEAAAKSSTQKELEILPK